MHGDRFIIVGGGLAGVTTLYELAAAGIPAVLLEAGPDLACGASHANGGALTPGLADPWNSPGVHRYLFRSLFDPASAMKIRLRSLPGLLAWGLEFLRNSTPARHSNAMIAGYELAAYSLARTRELASTLDIDFAARNAGFLKVFANEDEMQQSLDFCRTLEPHGLRWQQVTTDEALEIEPGLVHAADKIACGIFYPDEGSGDARTFTLALADRARALGGDVRLGASVQGIRASADRVTGVTVAGDFIKGKVIVSAGVDSPALVRPLGVSLPIKPAKGYSLTIDATPFLDRAPKTPIVDQHMHAAITPLGTRLRLAGTAEFTGRDARIRPERIENLFQLFERLFPHLVPELDRSTSVPWAGFRPMSADGMPFIGETGIEGLWLNSGHGHMGWSMAPGSARALCDLIEGRKPGIDVSPFSPARTAQ